MEQAAVQRFEELLSRRWHEVCERVGLPLDCLTWDFGREAHFRKPRGYAMAVLMDARGCHLRFAEKIVVAPEHRQDGLIRHELGHVVDFLVPPVELEMWAHRRNKFLPKTPERKADAIADAVWRAPIKYDDSLVQSTTKGKHPRPKHLGL